MPEYRKFYDSLDLRDGGVLAGPTQESRAFQAWFIKQRQRQQAPSMLTLSGRPQCRSCSAQQECDGGEGYWCVAETVEPGDMKSLRGCCKLDTRSTPAGRRLLSNSSLTAKSGPGTAGVLLGDVGCACNCTYVSEACCGAPGGTVSEPVSLQKEMLAPPNPTTCCDSSTGLFIGGTAKGNSTFCSETS